MSTKYIHEHLDDVFILLGYATAIIQQLPKVTTFVSDAEKNKFMTQRDWFLEASNNLMYLDKELPPMPDTE